MIRLPDLAQTAAWSWPSAAPPRAEAHDLSTWFQGGTCASGRPISSDLSAASRGLSVEQHAGRVMSHLLGEARDLG
jgi:hypothetical protein